MIIINKPDELHEVQCFKCKTILKVHPMTNMNSPWITDCDKHQPDIQSDQHQIGVDRCQHESDGMIYTSNPPQNKCVKCGDFYR